MSDTSGQKSFQKKLKEKTDEIKSLKTLLNDLEITVSDLEDEKRQLVEEKYATSAELARLRQINTLLLEQRNTDPSSNSDTTTDHHDYSSSQGDSLIEPNNNLYEREWAIDATTNMYQEICHIDWYDGADTCDRSCGKNHNIDFRRLSRGICYHEFAQEGSCRGGNNCRFGHNQRHTTYSTY